MIEYIKLIILSLICGVTLPLPVSSAAHFSLINGVIDFSDSKEVLGFYFSAMSLAFSAVIFIMLRKIYILGFKSLFNKDSRLTNYRKLMKNLLISVIPACLLFLPVSEGRLLCDLFDGFLVKNNILLVSVACIISALILVVSVWYTRQSYSVTKKGADTKTVIRSSVYQIISYIIPGISHVSSAGTNMLICDVESKIIIREIYLYIAPQMLIINAVKIVRYILADTIISPVMVIICVLSVLMMSTLVVTKMSKINIRRISGWFAVYGALLGVISAVLSFLLK